MVDYRAATEADAAILADLFVLTADWNPASVRGRAFWLADPVFETYIGGWWRPGDGGVIAEEAGSAVGGVWWRIFPESGPGYGFVDATTPELGIAVVAGHRGRGIGRRLLSAAAEVHPRLSLNVEDGNPARALYESAGFVSVGRSGDGTVMLLDGHPLG